MTAHDHIANAERISRERSRPCHTGLITMAVGGRTDHIPMNVLEGSYVLPADIVSGIGEGNTLAGSKIIDNMFKTGPFGVSYPTARTPAPQMLPTKDPNTSESAFSPEKYFTTPAGSTTTTNPTRAEGGPVMSGRHRPVPIVAAGGEYVIHPDVVRRLGGGDIDKGHDYLDKFVKGVRQHLIKTLSKLPGPRRD